jgi:hypothetical protein
MNEKLINFKNQDLLWIEETSQPDSARSKKTGSVRTDSSGNFIQLSGSLAKIVNPLVDLEKTNQFNLQL